MYLGRGTEAADVAVNGVGGGEECLGVFFDVSPDLLVVRDMDGRFNRVNHAWEAVLGYSRSELEGLEMQHLLHPDDVAATRRHIQKMERGGQAGGYTNRYRHKDGSYRTFEWRGKRVGQRLYGAARDITERRVQEARLTADRAAAMNASKAKNDFLTNVGHEIRTPLNGVIGLIGALARTELTEAQAEMVELIESSGATLERLLADLLDITKVEAGAPKLAAEPFGLNGLYALMETYRLLARDKGVAFEVLRDAPADLRLVGDIGRLRQVLGNLLSNAVKFTDEGKVTTRIFYFAGQRGRGALRLEVEDTGIGFDPALFSRADLGAAPVGREFGGGGLGFSICRSLTVMMGGQITVRSAPGLGSVFAVEIPVAVAQAAPAPAVNENAPLPRSGGGPLRILLAEDHPINQRVVQLLLEGQGVCLTTVDNGREALDAFQVQSFDMVLMDMQMPVMDGLTAVQAIRALEAERGQAPTPIAVLSANVQPQHHAASLAAGADLHIPKPLTAETLIGGMARALAVATPMQERLTA